VKVEIFKARKYSFRMFCVSAAKLHDDAYCSTKAPQHGIRTDSGFCIHKNIFFLPCSDQVTETLTDHLFSIDEQYTSLVRDFGPLDLGAVLRFCELMESKIESFASCKIILHCPMDPEICSNIAFLLGSFLVFDFSKPAQL
jgi:hypothetical protein